MSTEKCQFRYGPLAIAAKSTRSAAYDALPKALAALQTSGRGGLQASAIFVTKENGEMCRVSFFEWRVSERFWLVPRRNCLFTPELRWQPRGKRRILQVCKRDTLGSGYYLPGPRLEERAAGG